ncbi:uncharacterized protein N7483_003653 [Penicillium malachiteum]|uniref:uncharacterized protein n=1 Tax=Penicillium malachiteum TaxID=1324776 RepID=UPI002546E3E6|nr:uncharacterized protein N7483_003653 [Penicillium malachiteum]KAJ5729145.1 hypothetical protein N7483_003653 [Penicillium malachiteum]
MSTFIGRTGRALSRLKLSPNIAPKSRCGCPWTRALTSGPPYLPPRQFPTSGFVKVDPAEKVEEETLPFYVADKYYPVIMGEVFASRYQVVSKLGYGTSSTTWLCRDLHDHGFNTLKICAYDQKPIQEMAVSDRLKNASDHSGKSLVRLILESFQITGPHRKHTCLIYQPLGVSFTEL